MNLGPQGLRRLLMLVGVSVSVYSLCELGVPHWSRSSNMCHCLGTSKGDDDSLARVYVSLGLKMRVGTAWAVRRTSSGSGTLDSGPAVHPPGTKACPLWTPTVLSVKWRW